MNEKLIQVTQEAISEAERELFARPRVNIIFEKLDELVQARD